MWVLQTEGEIFHSRWCAPYACFGFMVTRADVRRGTIINYCFEIWAGVADAPRDFSEKCQPVTCIRESFTRIPIEAILSVTKFTNLLIHSRLVLIHRVCGCSRRLFENPQTGRRNRNITVSRLLIRPRRLKVRPWLVCVIFHYRISRSGTEG